MALESPWEAELALFGFINVYNQQVKLAGLPFDTKYFCP
jgi:hypothetical protein